MNLKFREHVENIFI